MKFDIQESLTVQNLAQMAHSRCLGPMWMMHILCLSTTATVTATPHSAQTEDILRAQDGLALPSHVMSHSRGISGIDARIDAPESQDAQTELEMPLMPMRRTLVADQLVHDILAYQLSRDVLRARWSDSWHEDLPCSTPSNSGLVPKMGTASQSPSMVTIGEKRKVYVSEEFPVYSSCMVRSFNLNFLLGPPFDFLVFVTLFFPALGCLFVFGAMRAFTMLCGPCQATV